MQHNRLTRGLQGRHPSHLTISARQHEPADNVGIHSGQVPHLARFDDGLHPLSPQSLRSDLDREQILESLARLTALECPNQDFLLAKAGKVSAEVREIIIEHPRLFAALLRKLRDVPEEALTQVVREIETPYCVTPQ